MRFWEGGDTGAEAGCAEAVILGRVGREEAAEVREDLKAAADFWRFDMAEGGGQGREVERWKEEDGGG